MGKGTKKKQNWRSFEIPISPTEDKKGDPIHHTDQPSLGNAHHYGQDWNAVREPVDQMYQLIEQSEPTNLSTPAWYAETPLSSHTPYTFIPPPVPLIPSSQVVFMPVYYYYPVIHQSFLPADTGRDILEKDSVEENDENMSSELSGGENRASRDKLAKRRKKKKRPSDSEKSVSVEEIDSGYLNGTESSSELSSEYDPHLKEFTVKTDITQSGQNEFPVQFGDVQDILDEIAKAAESERKCALDIISPKGQTINTDSIKSNKNLSKVDLLSIENVKDNVEIVYEQKTENISVDTSKRIKAATAVIRNSREEARFELNDTEVKDLGKTEEWKEVKFSRKKNGWKPAYEKSFKNQIHCEEKEVKKTKIMKETKKKHLKKELIEQLKVKEEVKSSQKDNTATEPLNKIKKIVKKKFNEKFEIQRTGEELEKIKQLFFEEKDVEIIECPKDSEKTVKRNNSETKKIRTIWKEQMSKKIFANNHFQPEDSVKMIANAKVPVIFIKPDTHDSSTLSEQLERLPQAKQNAINYVPSKHLQSSQPNSELKPVTCVSIGLTLKRSPAPEQTLLHRRMEDQLLKQKIIFKCAGQETQSNKKVVILRGREFQKQEKKKPKKKVEESNFYPGPRLKYSTVIRTGLLGASRNVVPPYCLVNGWTVV